MTRALIFSLPAAHRFQRGIELSADWSDTLLIGGDEHDLCTIKHGSANFVFRQDEQSIEPSVVILIENGKLFSCFNSASARLEAITRALAAATLILEQGGELPSYWRPYSGGKYITLQATAVGKGDARRLCLWRRLPPASNPCVFVFDVTSTQREYEALSPDINFLDGLLSFRTEALKKLPGALGPQIGAKSLSLDDLRNSDQVDAVTHGWKLSHLYKSRLTTRQRDFVDAEMDRPIRLKGAAGTGKTLAMVAKLLTEGRERKKSGLPYRYLFVTHNTSAAELALAYARGLDEDDILSANDAQFIKIDTLLGIAIDNLADDLGDYQPISNDADTGKRLQLIAISHVLTEYAGGTWITRKKGAAPALARSIEAPQGTGEHEIFCWEVMNEIACILDADGVRDSAIKRESYIRNRRRSKYLLPLDSVADREVMLDIYDRYRDYLRQEGFISVDQLTADYIGFLDSYRWDARRSRQGYDAIFVDEYHLFSSLERAAFPSLVRTSGDSFPVILMALDPRQSPRAVFLDSIFGLDEFGRPFGKGEAKNLRDFEFPDVFRYTPQIANLLAHINHSFPEHDLAEEWLPSIATSPLPEGELPKAFECKNRITQYDQAVAEAEAIIKKNRKGKVAILTLSGKAFFEQIAEAGRYYKKFHVVDSRESLNQLQYSGGKIVFSMPEYVAGVQFDHVIVTDVNEQDDFGRQTAVSRGRFGSNLYLAASRARYSTSMFGDRTKGGLAAVLRGAIEAKLVVEA